MSVNYTLLNKKKYMMTKKNVHISCRINDIAYHILT